MIIIKPSTTNFPSAPNARILTDLRHRELVTDPARIASIDFASTRTGGPATLVYDKANWDATLLLPDFPGSAGAVGPVVLAPGEEQKIAAAVNDEAAQRLKS